MSALDPISLRLEADMAEHLREWGDGTAQGLEPLPLLPVEPCRVCGMFGAHTYGCARSDLP